MKFSISTARLESILGIVSKGVGGKNTLPITEYIHLELTEGMLQVTATDIVNFITYTVDEIGGEEGVALVKADTLIKLVQKTTKSELHFELKEETLHVKGNGNYKLPTMDASQFPTYEFEFTGTTDEVEVQALKRMFKTNSSAVATELLMPFLTGYRVGEDAITTDGVKMCINGVDLLDNNEILFTQKMADLISILTAEKAKIDKSDNKILIRTDNIEIFGAELEGIEQFPNVVPVLGIDYQHKAILDRVELIKALDRLSLFVDGFQQYGVELYLQDKALVITDSKQQSREEIELQGHFGPNISTGNKLVVNINFFKSLLSAMKSEELEIKYDLGMPIQMVDGEVTFVLGQLLLEE